jgi:NAD(P)-dependent dehydrogenase (short-subunit alcohol dehydrogenase family)
MTALAGKVALVTGASRGIGRAISERFAHEGARVVICGRKRDTLAEVAQANPEHIIPIACHVGKAEQVNALLERARAEAGPIDILVNNAATNIAQGPCLEMNEAQFDKMIEINLKSAFRLVNLVAPEMCRRGNGSIINIASVAGIQPQFHSFLYSMTKAALIMMTKSWAQELGPSGVNVNAIAPGLVKTALSEYYWKDEARRELFLGRQAIRRIGEPADIVETALLLASAGSSYLTGQVLVVDGGLLVS